MFQKILFSVILFGSSLSFAQGHRPPRLTDEARSAIESCGLSLPERGTRPSREEHEAIQSCLSEAGIEMPQRGQKRQRRGDDDYQQSSGIN